MRSVQNGSIIQKYQRKWKYSNCIKCNLKRSFRRWRVICTGSDSGTGGSHGAAGTDVLSGSCLWSNESFSDWFYRGRTEKLYRSCLWFQIWHTGHCTSCKSRWRLLSGVIPRIYHCFQRYGSVDSSISADNSSKEKRCDQWYRDPDRNLRWYRKSSYGRFCRCTGNKNHRILPEGRCKPDPGKTDGNPERWQYLRCCDPRKLWWRADRREENLQRQWDESRAGRCRLSVFFCKLNQYRSSGSTDCILCIRICKSV